MQINFPIKNWCDFFEKNFDSIYCNFFSPWISSGLYFNSLTDGCDFRRNVDCDGKDETEEEDEQPSSTTSRTTAAKPKKPGEPETLEDVLEAIKDAGLTYLLIYLAYSGFFL